MKQKNQAINLRKRKQRNKKFIIWLDQRLKAQPDYALKNIKMKVNKMAKMLKPKGKMIKGCDYAEDDEQFDKKQIKKAGKSMKTVGIAKELKLSQKEQGYSKKPRIKPQKKMAKPVKGQEKVY